MALALDRFWRLLRRPNDGKIESREASVSLPRADSAFLPPIESIVVDHRERAGGFAAALTSAFDGTPVTVGTLPCGDVVLGARLAIERKRTDDFAASLRDGRLFEQAARMADEFPERILLVEGSFDREAVGGLSGAAIRGALLSLALDWRAVPIRTKDVNDSAAFVVQARARLLARAHRRPRAPRIAGEKIDIAAPAAVLLATIPGVGAQRADAIAARFGTAALLMHASEAELAEIEGVGRETARAVKRVFHESGESS